MLSNRQLTALNLFQLSLFFPVPMVLLSMVISLVSQLTAVHLKADNYNTEIYVNAKNILL